MGLEAGDYISDLVQTNPTGTDQKLQGDDHIRLLKKVLLQTFPNLDAAVDATPEILNSFSALFPLTDDYYIRANGTAALELRSPAQVLADIGADNASNLASGTVADARLSSNVPLKDDNNSYTGSNAFAAGSAATPLLRFSGDGDSGFYQISTANQIGLSLGGSAAVQFINGGIPVRITGTSDPTQPSVRYGIYTTDFTTERAYWGFPTTGNDQLIVRNIAGDNMEFRCAANASRLRLDDTTGLIYESPVNGPSDAEVGFRRVVRETTGGTLTAAMVGTCQAVSAGVTVPNSVFAAGDAVQVYNNSASAITITQGSGVTLRLGGTTTTGNRTLAARGIAYLWWNSASECIAMGSVT